MTTRRIVAVVLGLCVLSAIVLIGAVVAFLLHVNRTISRGVGDETLLHEMYKGNPQAIAETILVPSFGLTEYFGEFDRVTVVTWPVTDELTERPDFTSRVVTFRIEVRGKEKRGEAYVTVRKNSRVGCWEGTLWYLMVEGERIQLSREYDVSAELGGCLPIGSEEQNRAG